MRIKNAATIGVVVLQGCTWGGASRTSAGPLGQARTATSSRQRLTLGLDELQRFNGQSLLTAIRQLDPTMLEARRPTPYKPAGETPAVYLDGTLQGDLRALDQIPVQRVVYVRRLSESEAFTRFARRHVGGALIVATR